ncbi:TolC family protein [Sphingobacterium sp. DK4209]|uniref:TolC family protein n=2 Tax=Sphingobacterium zhuxiongii TaxID=2662364 RepID=A0A5Q0QF40_9SPHI|nr:TolC family protein [Sphingobacterium sp. DK4209]QGA28173.1 TolC family protein [Sphingobacterium sp. dk4302]
MKTVNIHFPILILLLLLGKVGIAQESILDTYVKQGLDSNLVLVEKDLSLKKAMNGLEVARSMFLPNITFDLTYSHADGGRSIDLPVGDMLNPVYATLNQLTNSQNFPQIANEKINFLPKNYYDAKIRTAVPIINTDLKHNKTIREQVLKMSKQEIELYQRELVKDIKVAYFNYLSALDAVSIYKNAISLANEGKRVNQKLLDAGKGLPAYVIRADAEIAQQESKLAEAEQQLLNAQYYFNALLNRSATAKIDILAVQGSIERTSPETLSVGIEGREELKSLSDNIAIQETVLEMNKQVFVPKLSAFLDLGSQAEGLRVSSKSQYYMIGAQLSFPIFAGNRNRLKIQEGQIAVAEAENKLAQAKQKLELSANMAKNELVATQKNFESSKIQMEAAATYQRLIQRGFNEGVNTYLETIDARSQYTNAKLAHNIAAFKLLSAAAKFERETASYPLN